MSIPVCVVHSLQRLCVLGSTYVNTCVRCPFFATLGNVDLVLCQYLCALSILCKDCVYLYSIKELRGSLHAYRWKLHMQGV